MTLHHLNQCWIIANWTKLQWKDMFDIFHVYCGELDRCIVEFVYQVYSNVPLNHVLSVAVTTSWRWRCFLSLSTMKPPRSPDPTTWVSNHAVGELIFFLNRISYIIKKRWSHSFLIFFFTMSGIIKRCSTQFHTWWYFLLQNKWHWCSYIVAPHWHITQWDLSEADLTVS